MSCAARLGEGKEANDELHRAGALAGRIENRTGDLASGTCIYQNPLHGARTAHVAHVEALEFTLTVSQ